MTRFLTLIILIGLFIFVTGCSSTGVLCSVPEAENSTICKVSDKLHTTPEIISQSLLVANFGALESDVYTAKQADKFIDKIIADIEHIQAMGDKISYVDAIKYITQKFDLLPADVQAIFIIINPAGMSNLTIDQPLTGYDFYLLIQHLKKQKQIISVYL